ncbi:threonine aldolase [Streptomyces oceani]|uniref:Threonine aldolase n=1 Tax=Streptomyces oceani TaxID=1075402 RepID=A0A1E7JV97_9ACTN|nr:threonine aldolase [Streptomyces oceani]
MAEEHEAVVRRRLAAWTGATRKLSRGPVAGTLAERLDQLAREGAEAYDLSDWTDTYGNRVVAELERRTAETLGTEAAAFFPTGTMAQQVALRCWAGRTANRTVAMHPLAHPEQWERDALSQLTGLRVVHPTQAPRMPYDSEVRALREPFGTLALELPLREAGFLLPDWDELTATVAVARERDAVVHFDGARLWECAPHFGRGLPEIAELADSVYVSFYKSLGGLSGAALAGSAEFIEETTTWRHRYGGQLFQQWPAALSALAGLDRELPRLPEYVARAKEVAEALRAGCTAAGVSWVRIQPEVPHTHQFLVWLPYDAEALTEAAVRTAEETGVALFRIWDHAGLPGIAHTEVLVEEPGLAWSTAEITAAVVDFLSRVR